MISSNVTLPQEFHQEARPGAKRLHLSRQFERCPRRSRTGRRGGSGDEGQTKLLAALGSSPRAPSRPLTDTVTLTLQGSELLP